jgi:cardiolipin synthase
LATRVKAARSRRKQHDDSVLEAEFERFKTLRILALVSILAVTGWFVAALFAPGLRYSLATPPQASIESESFLKELEPLVNSKIARENQVQVLSNGENFYEAEIFAIRQAQHSINIEAYIFHKGEVTRRLLEVLTERARSGVKVRLVLDSLGTLATPKRYFKSLTQAGGRVEWYHPLRWNNWFHSNNRTHRELMVIDGSVAFLGGAGFADWWRFSKKSEPRWRDTMFRVQGDAVPSLQGNFVENWLEASGEILDGPDYFPLELPRQGRTPALVVASTPSSGGSTRSRILFQMLIAAAKKSIYITTPYFLPDRSMRQEMVRAVQRGVAVKILVPGKHNDHYLTRSSGRSVYGDLLKAGAEIYEYETSMIHAKIMMVDGAWIVVGSTNLDSRSFGINDEINLAGLDHQLAAALTQEFDQDLSQSQRITLQEWRNRPIYERPVEWLGWVVARQQ